METNTIQRIYSFCGLHRNENEFALDANNLKNIRVAAIMDEFTEECFRAECTLLQLTPKAWLEELVEFRPQLLFVESAWRGKEKLWAKKVNSPQKEILGVVEYCNRHHIPTMFWNKEDPVNYNYFISIAWAFDYVFTTDIDSIPRYMEDLGHRRVYHLHFAAQPIVHNPIEKYERKDKCCFAGSYYKKYPDREIDFQRMADTIMSLNGLDIYDRNYNRNLSSFEFPERYQECILGTLPPGRIDEAYKRYYYNINMNSVKQSSTMFARRVFELMASNTVVISNYAKGIKSLFGDLVFCSDDETELKEELRRLTDNRDVYFKYRLVGLRKILKEHLYEDRFAYIIDKIFHKRIYYQMPAVTVCAYAKDVMSRARITELFEKQTLGNKKLLLIDDKENWRAGLIDTPLTSFFDSKDYYGENYLMDLVLSYRYIDADAVGKAHYFELCGQEALLTGVDEEYRYVRELSPYRSVCKTSYLVRMEQWPETYIGEGNNLFSIDRYNYCENFGGCSLEAVDDLTIADQGEKMDFFYQRVCAMEPENSYLTVLQDKNLFRHASTKWCKIFSVNSNIVVLSALPYGNSEEISSDYIIINKNDNYTCFYSLYATNKVRVACIYYDENKNKISSEFVCANTRTSMTIPENSVYLKILVRFISMGKVFIPQFTFGIEKG